MVAESIRLRSPAEKRMAGYLARIATGPELSKDLLFDEAKDGMELILRGEVDAVQSAVFLIALRMKRESHDELSGALAALRGQSDRAVAAVDDLVDMAEPYNGYVRHLPAAPFIPAVLAACGVPCVLHGVRESGPKWGLTPHRILHAAGVALDLSAAQAAEQVDQVGWAYVDQAQICLQLAGLARLRTLIVKRPCLSLLEKLMQPISARGRNHLWVGYAHTGYPEILERLARSVDYDSMLAVRGVESGVLTSLTGRVRGARYLEDDPLEPVEIAPSEAIGPAQTRAPALPSNGEQAVGKPASGPPESELLESWASEAARRGRAALAGEAGATHNMLVLGAATVLRHLTWVENLAQGAERARTVIASGEALRRFEAVGSTGVSSNDAR